MEQGVKNDSRLFYFALKEKKERKRSTRFTKPSPCRIKVDSGELAMKKGKGNPGDGVKK
jgi:hypothetical protein